MLHLVLLLLAFPELANVCLLTSFDKLVASASASNDIKVSNAEGPDVYQASGGEWNKDLLFNVPRQHEEVQRLEGRYKK